MMSSKIAMTYIYIYIYTTFNSENSYFNTTESDGVVLEIKTSSHCINDRFWLLENFLLHEVLVITLHNLLDLHLQNRNFSSMRIIHTTTNTMNIQSSIHHSSNVVILINYISKNFKYKQITLISHCNYFS